MSSKRIEAKYDSATWQETDIKSVDDATLRVTRTRTERTFTGGMNGKGVTEYNFVYHAPAGEENKPAPKEAAEQDPHKNSLMCTYNGVMVYKGTIEGIDGEGEIVFEINGTWGKDGVKKAVGDWKTIPESGVGAFKNLKASGGYNGAAKEMPCWIQLD